MSLTTVLRQFGNAFRMLVPGMVSILMVHALADAGNVSLQVRKRVKCDYNWHFYKGSPSGNPGQVSYNDSGAGWAKVSVPHSASYEKPWEEPSFNGPTDVQFYSGTCWYRKTLPAMPQGGKKFLEFEAAMQVAKIWVNGTLAGSHDISGYTGFCVDVTSLLKSSGANSVACSLDNIKSADIPPGTASTDYEVYSGIYRDVWFIATGDVYIPYCGQLIDPCEVSAASGKFKIRTKVTNNRSQQVQCVLTSFIRDSSGTDLCSVSDTLSVPAGQNLQSTRITPAIASPHLWSPEKPYLYQVYTQVKVDGTVTDDYAQTHGLLFFAFTNNNGLMLNGSKYVLKGTNYHQSFGWVHNAMPTSRYWEEVKLMKAAGFNSIRCSHYPRDPDFYEACDKLGVFLIVEPPTWGGTSYSSAFWNRLNQAVKDMVMQGYNHPSIIAWGAFNEPLADLSANIRAIRDSIRTLDTARKVYVARQPWSTPDADCNAVDIVGLSYTTSRSNANWTCLETEYDDLQVAIRGGTNGIDASQEISNSNTRSSNWDAIAGLTWIAGGFTWVFNDYSGQGNRATHGVVDMMRVPKYAYYMYRQKYLGTAPDYPVSGTATKIDLTADVTTLDADGSDLSLIKAALRDASGACINVVKPIQFTVTGPATLFGDASKSTVEGKINALVKSTTTAGQISITAQCSGLPDAVVTLTSRSVVDSLDPATPFTNVSYRPAASVKQSRITPVLRRTAHGLIIDFGRGSSARAVLATINGRAIATRRESEASSIMTIPEISKGVYILMITDESGAKIIKPYVVK
jgi:beta-galactosidase